jgi:hypothetical protein
VQSSQTHIISAQIFGEMNGKFDYMLQIYFNFDFDIFNAQNGQNPHSFSSKFQRK